MTILQNLIQQPIDSSDDIKRHQERIGIDEAINIQQLNRFLDEAVADMRRNPIGKSEKDNGR